MGNIVIDGAIEWLKDDATGDVVGYKRKDGTEGSVASAAVVAVANVTGLQSALEAKADATATTAALAAINNELGNKLGADQGISPSPRSGAAQSTDEYLLQRGSAVITVTHAQLMADMVGSTADFGPADKLAAPVQHVTSQTEMSPTIVRNAVASVTAYKARIQWINNGATPGTMLNIAVNPENDAHALSIVNNVDRRNHQITLGDAVMLVSPVPITSLSFTSSAAIATGLHRLLVTFGN